MAEIEFFTPKRGQPREYHYVWQYSNPDGNIPIGERVVKGNIAEPLIKEENDRHIYFVNNGYGSKIEDPLIEWIEIDTQKVMKLNISKMRPLCVNNHEDCQCLNHRKYRGIDWIGPYHANAVQKPAAERLNLDVFEEIDVDIQELHIQLDQLNISDRPKVKKFIADLITGTPNE